MIADAPAASAVVIVVVARSTSITTAVVPASSEASTQVGSKWTKMVGCMMRGYPVTWSGAAWLEVAGRLVEIKRLGYGIVCGSVHLQETQGFIPFKAVTTMAIVDKSGSRVKRMFGQIAPRYDRMNHLLSMNVDRYWRWRTVRRVAPEGTAPILDVCTGTADLALAYCRRTRGNVEVVGTDFCPQMLEVGEQKKTRLAYAERLSLVEADTQELPFEDDYFQIVSVAFGLRNVQDTDRGLAEMWRVCRPGGRVAILEFSEPTWQPFKACYGWYFRNVLPRIGQWIARNDEDAYNYLPESVGQFPSGKALLDKMTQAGFRQVCQHRYTLGIATLYVGIK